MIVNKIEKYKLLLKSAIQIGLEKSAMEVERSAKKLTPVDLGVLRNSINYVMGDNEAFVGTNVEYAEKVHEDMNSRHKVGGPKYLERGLNENKTNIKNFVDREVAKIKL